MAESDSSLSQKITPKLEEFTSSLRIKLKLPKIEQDYPQKNNNLINSAPNNREDDEEHEDEKVVIAEKNVPNLRFCEFCNRSFESGKALGGHMRVHAPNYKGNKKVSAATMGSTSNSMSSPEAAEAGGEANQGAVKCELCPKEFRSLKSLFGHMRSHPDRLWRGMNPPQHYLAAENSSAAEARLRSLGSWRVTGKRGRTGSCSSPVGSSSSSYGSHAEAAADLMLLLAGGGGARGRNECRVGDVDGFDDDDEDGDDEVSRANKKGKGLMVINNNDEDETRLFDDDEIYYLKNLGFLPNYKVNDDVTDDGGVIRVHNNLIINNFDNHGDSSIKVLPSSSPPIIKGSKKVAKINHKTINYLSESIELNHHHNYPNPIENNVNRFVCSTCGKSFPSHQALGGHRSSHNKDKYNNNNIVIQTRGVDASGLTDTGLFSENGGDYSEDGQGQGQDDVEAAVIGEHKCKTCNKIFASGQALGGHQRSHYVPDNISSSPGQTSYQTVRNGNSEVFDLNDPPMMNVDNNNDDEDVGDVTFDSN